MHIFLVHGGTTFLFFLLQILPPKKIVTNCATCTISCQIEVCSCGRWLSCESVALVPSTPVVVWYPCESVLPRSVSHHSAIPISHTPNDLKYAAHFFLLHSPKRQAATVTKKQAQYSKHPRETFSHVGAYPSPQGSFILLSPSNRNLRNVRLSFRLQNSRASMFEFYQKSAEIFLCIQFLSG